MAFGRLRTCIISVKRAHTTLPSYVKESVFPSTPPSRNRLSGSSLESTSTTRISAATICCTAGTTAYVHILAAFPGCDVKLFRGLTIIRTNAIAHAFVEQACACKYPWHAAACTHHPQQHLLIDGAIRFLSGQESRAQRGEHNCCSTTSQVKNAAQNSLSMGERARGRKKDERQ